MLKFKKVGSMDIHIANNFTEFNNKLDNITAAVKNSEKNRLAFEEKHDKSVKDLEVVKSDHAIRGATMGVTFGGSFLAIIIIATIITVVVVKLCGVPGFFKRSKNRTQNRRPVVTPAETPVEIPEDELVSYRENSQN